MSRRRRRRSVKLRIGGPKRAFNISKPGLIWIACVIWYLYCKYVSATCRVGDRYSCVCCIHCWQPRVRVHMVTEYTGATVINELSTGPSVIHMRPGSNVRYWTRSSTLLRCLRQLMRSCYYSVSSHKPTRIYMGGLILGVNTLYCYFHNLSNSIQTKS